MEGKSVIMIISPIPQKGKPVLVERLDPKNKLIIDELLIGAGYAQNENK